MSFHFNAKLSEAEHVSNSLVPFYKAASTFKYFLWWAVCMNHSPAGTR